ncbi:hypothetical protein D3C86_875380 [compost metagenome]
MAQVPFHGFRREPQGAGDFLVGQGLGQQAHDFDFPLAQRLDPGRQRFAGGRWCRFGLRDRRGRGLGRLQALDIKRQHRVQVFAGGDIADQFQAIRMGVEEAAHQAKALTSAQGFDDFDPCLFMVAAFGLDHGAEHQQARCPELATMPVAGFDQSFYAIASPVQITLDQLPASAGILGQDVDFLQGRVPGIRVTRVDGFQARQFGLGLCRLPENQQPAHLPGQAVGLQALQTEFDRVLIQPLDKRQGFLMVTCQPLHIP